MRFQGCYKYHKKCNGDKCSMKFFVLPWDQSGGGWYKMENAVAGYMFESMAKMYVEKMNGRGCNYVVRPVEVVR